MPDEPASLLPIVREERAKYPTPIPNERLGELMNAIALRGGDGWGLAAKDTGAHTVQPVTGTLVSRDVLIYASSELMYDVLQDVAGAAVPQWLLIGDQDMEWVVPIATEVDPAVKGNPWPCFEDGRAPVLAMTPEGPQPTGLWTEWIMNAYPEHVVMKIDGTHTPLDGALTSHFRNLYRANSERGLVTMGWCVFENEGGPADALQVVASFANMYDATPSAGWLILGPVWDVWQAQGFGDDTNDWIDEAEAIVGDRNILIGARARRGLDRYGGSFTSFETHVNDAEAAFTIFGQSVVMSTHDRMVGEFDRFRIRPGSGREKDMTEEDIPIICEAARARNVAIIIGHQNDTGARPFEFRETIRDVLTTEPEPPPDPPSFDYVTAPGIVDHDELFQIRWSALNADVVKLQSDTYGPIDFGLPTEGVLDHRVQERTRYTIEASRDASMARDSFVVESRPPRRSWWEILLGWFGSIRG